MAIEQWEQDADWLEHYMPFGEIATRLRALGRENAELRQQRSMELLAETARANAAEAERYAMAEEVRALEEERSTRRAIVDSLNQLRIDGEGVREHVWTTTQVNRIACPVKCLRCGTVVSSLNPDYGEVPCKPTETAEHWLRHVERIHSGYRAQIEAIRPYAERLVRHIEQGDTANFDNEYDRADAVNGRAALDALLARPPAEARRTAPAPQAQGAEQPSAKDLAVAKALRMWAEWFSGESGSSNGLAAAFRAAADALEDGK